MEDYLKILKVEYLSIHLLDPFPIQNISLDDRTILYNFNEWNYLQWKSTKKY
jgi:hypothetical protein